MSKTIVNRKVFDIPDEVHDYIVDLETRCANNDGLEAENKHLHEDNAPLLMRLTDCTRIMDSLRAKRDELQAENEELRKHLGIYLECSLGKSIGQLEKEFMDAQSYMDILKENKK